MLLIVQPLSTVLLARVNPVHHALPTLLVFLPLTLIEVAAGVVHLAVAVLQAVYEITLIDAAVIEGHFPLAMTIAVLPLSFVGAILEYQLTLAMAKTVFDLPFV